VVILKAPVPRLPLFVALGLMLWGEAARAQESPPRELLNAILPQLVRKLPATKISFEVLAKAQTDRSCGLKPFAMKLTDDRNTRTFSVLADPGGSPAAPREVLARITRLAVDADGAERAYHPEDPYGEGVCRRISKPDGVALEGICALDPFASASIRIFLGANRLAKPELAAHWKDFWPLVREKKLKSFDLQALAGREVPGGYYLFYWKERNLTAVFTRNVIPMTRDGYPCVRGPESRHPGYFVAATSLKREASERADGCAPGRYLDAEQIPFFVLPGASFGQVNLGDIVVGYLTIGAQERIVFGIAGDMGPFDQFGEGSVAFNRALLGSSAVVMNSMNAKALHIDLARKGEGALAILVLGGTRHLLRGDYSRAAIERVGREQFARWNGGTGLARLKTCIAQAPVNQ
jgi:hypothetical protein